MALKIEFSKKAKKQLLKAPRIVQDNVEEWLRSIKTIGLEATRSSWGAGLHDEPLKGIRSGQRSIRLGKAWRLIHEVNRGELVIARVNAITKHDYR